MSTRKPRTRTERRQQTNTQMLTTRFTTETFQENKRFRDIHNIPCIYSSSLPISDKLPYQDYYVLEMNNSINRIMGIGKISKTLQTTERIYSYKYYNRYTYKGTSYAKIYDAKIYDAKIYDAKIYDAKIYDTKLYDTELCDTQLCKKETLPQQYRDIIERVERKIFYGKGHIKRGSSFTSFPIYKHTEDIPDLISVFNYIMSSKIM